MLSEEPRERLADPVIDAAKECFRQFMPEVVREDRDAMFDALHDALKEHDAALVRQTAEQCALIAESEITRSSYNARADVAAAIRSTFEIGEKR